MQLLSAASAWFAAALPAILLLYALKRNYRDAEVSSHLLWKRVWREQEANRPWQKLRNRLLMLIQLLAAALLVFALMEPVVGKTAASDGHAVLLIDRSWSMTAYPPAEPGARESGEGAGGRLTRLQLAVQEAARWLDEQAGERPVSIVVNGRVPEALAIRSTDYRQLKETLREIAPYYGYADNAAALSFADSLHRGEEGGETIVHTDGRWPDAGEAGALPLQAPVRLELAGGEASSGNAAVLSFGIEAAPGGGELARGTVTVRNDGAEDRSLPLEVWAVNEGETPRLVRELELHVPAGEWQSAAAEGLPPADYYVARLVSDRDGAAADDTAYQFPSVAADREVLVVTEGNLFLEKALLLAGVRPVRIAPDAKAPAEREAGAVAWIVADGSYERLLEDEGWSSLLGSKPLWIIDHPADENGRVPVSPHGSTVKDHPVTTYITFQDTHIARLRALEPAETAWGETIISYGGLPAIIAGDEKGMPRLRFTFALHDSDLPLRPEFPVLAVQAADWLSGGASGHLGTVVAGQTIEPNLHAAAANAWWEPVEAGPDDSGQEGNRMPLPLGSGESYEAPAVPGLYRLTEADSEGNRLNSRYLAVTADPAEWQRSPDRLSLGSAGTTDVPLPGDEGAAAERNDAGHAAPLTGWIAGLLLLVMAAEWEVYRRGH